MNHETVTILGAAGAIGKSLVPSLLTSGATVRVVGRDRARLQSAFSAESIEKVSADLTTEAGCRAALQGAATAVYSLGLPYTKQAFAKYPEMMSTCLTAARQVGLRKLILITNVYSYGRPTTALVSENHPRNPCSVKGEYRKQQEDRALEAHGKDGLAVVSLRIPDFYGFDAPNSLGGMIFGTAAQGKKANLLKPIDTPHQLFYTPDIGPIIVALQARSDLFGTAYNVAGDESITIRDFALKVYAAFGHTNPRFMIAGKGLLTLLGIFSPLLRELKEMTYLQETPVLLDGSKLRRALPNISFTGYKAGIMETAKLMQRQTG